MADPKPTVEQLMAELADLKKKLGVLEQEKQEAQALATAAPYIGSSIEEQPTGNTVTRKICINPWERKESKQKFKEVEVPTYFYNIQLPAGAGLSLSTNGVHYYHGETYEFDLHELADIKARVARCWDHEKSIHGDNENAYRKPTNKHLISRAAQARMIRR